METAATTPTAVLAIDSVLSALFGLLAIAAGGAFGGRWHSNTTLARWYWGVLAACAVVRCIKFAVPEGAVYVPFTTPPDVNTPHWWLMLGEWVVFVSGNSTAFLCYSLILRMWHNALSIVAYGGKAPVWPQLMIVYLVAISMATDGALTIVLAFVTPDVVNVVNAFKDTLVATVIAACFVGYWYLLRRSLKQIASLGVGRSMTGLPSTPENTISEKAMRKLRRISWVSIASTVGALYRAADLFHFALAVVRLIPIGIAGGGVELAIDRVVFYVTGDILPAVTMLVVMMKCGGIRRPDTGSLQSADMPPVSPMRITIGGSSRSMRPASAGYAFTPLN